MTDYPLNHPLYLDEQMMISFLAYLKGGVAFQDEETRRLADVHERRGEASGKLKLPSLAAVFSAEAALTGSATGRAEGSAEYRAARHHTAASLFNALYEYLHEDDRVTRIETGEETTHLRPGQLVEVSGSYAGNPLEDLLDILGQLVPYFEDSQQADGSTPAEEERPKNPRKSGNPAVRSQAEVIEAERARAAEIEEAQQQVDETGKRIMLRMREDIKQAPIHDLLLKTSTGLQIVLTVSSRYYSPETSESLRASHVTILGKVTRILTGDESINLTRRTAMGAAGDEITADIVAQGSNLGMEESDPVVFAPAIQVLPMALFI